MINNDTLEMLPIDSHLTNLASVTLPSTEVEFSTEHDDSPYSSAHLQSTFIPASAGACSGSPPNVLTSV